MRKVRDLIDDSVYDEIKLTQSHQIPGYSLMVLPASYSYGRPSDSEYD